MAHDKTCAPPDHRFRPVHWKANARQIKEGGYHLGRKVVLETMQVCCVHAPMPIQTVHRILLRDRTWRPALGDRAPPSCRLLRPRKTKASPLRSSGNGAGVPIEGGTTLFIRRSSGAAPTKRYDVRGQLRKFVPVCTENLDPGIVMMKSAE